jgi:hypothetical protein
VRALGHLVGRAAVDGVDADQRREALGAPRRAHGPGDAVTRDQLAALDLRRGDVDVVVGRLGRQAQEPGAVGQQLDRALGDALIATRDGFGGRRGGLVAIDERTAVAVLLLAAPAPAAATAATRALGRVVVGLGSRGPRGRRGHHLDGVGLDVGHEVVVGLGCVGDLLAGLTREDGVHQFGLAQAAEAVHAELVGE